MLGNDEEEENLTETQFAGWQGKGGKGSQLGDRQWSRRHTSPKPGSVKNIISKVVWGF